MSRSESIATPRSLIERITPAYQGRPVLVTGGMSFIGSHLVEALATAGASVIVADDLSSGKEENVERVRHRIRFLQGDLRYPAFAREACRGIDIVFHLAAAHGGRGYIDSHPVESLNNMTLDHTVFAASTAEGARRIVFASSACVYPTTLQNDDRKRVLLREEDAGFDEPGLAFADGEYGWSKLMGELQLRAFHRQHQIEGIVCRIFTAFGERENESHAVIALIAKAMARLDPYPIWGDGRQTRNFTYVGDTVSGLLLAGAILTGYQVINVGTPDHHTIDELLEVIFRLAGWRPNEIERQIDRPVGVRSRAADVAKCERLLGWRPGYELAEGINRTLRWYRATAAPERLARLDTLLTTR